MKKYTTARPNLLELYELQAYTAHNELNIQYGVQERILQNEVLTSEGYSAATIRGCVYARLHYFSTDVQQI